MSNQNSNRCNIEESIKIRSQLYGGDGDTPDPLQTLSLGKESDL